MGFGFGVVGCGIWDLELGIWNSGFGTRELGLRVVSLSFEFGIMDFGVQGGMLWRLGFWGFGVFGFWGFGVLGSWYWNLGIKI